MFSSRGERKSIESFRLRLYILSVAIAISFLVIFFQLLNLQLIHGSGYTARSRSNMENFVPLIAPRGLFYGRHYQNGRESQPLIKNRVSFNITTIPAKFAKKSMLQNTLKRLAQLSAFPYDKLMENVEKEKSPHLKTILIDDIHYDKLVKIASQIDTLPHISWETVPKRDYFHKDLYSHVIGYTGRISRKELNRLHRKGYYPYHDIGKMGLEKEYDKLLRGQDGRIKKIVNVRRKIQREEIDKYPVPGKNLVLTLDHRIQEIVQRATEKYAGVGVGVLVMRPYNGEVLALLSRPSFDPNFLIQVDNQAELNRLLEDENKPFLNRVIQIKNPPSSTFKPLVGLTALEENKVNSNEKFFCAHKYILKGLRDRTFYCWGYHRSNDLVGGIANSCNVYFYNVGLRLGSRPILKYARYFGLNEKTGIDIPGEIQGFLPSDAWKRRVFKQRWFDGDTLNLSIGQGFLQFTPVAMASVYSGLINDGIIYQPHLVREIRDPVSDEVLQRHQPKILREVPVDPRNLRIIREGLRQVVVRGTTSFMNNPKLKIAGKTGTVQTISITHGREHLRRKNDSQHAWFVGYAPYEGKIEDIILVAVFVQYGRTGSGGAAPIAYRIFLESLLKPGVKREKQ